MVVWGCSKVSKLQHHDLACLASLRQARPPFLGAKTVWTSVSSADLTRTAQWIGSLVQIAVETSCECLHPQGCGIPSATLLFRELKVGNIWPPPTLTCLPVLSSSFSTFSFLLSHPPHRSPFSYISSITTQTLPVLIIIPPLHTYHPFASIHQETCLTHRHSCMLSFSPIIRPRRSTLHSYSSVNVLSPVACRCAARSL